VLGNADSSSRILGATEGHAAAAMEQLVAGEGCTRLLVELAENVAAVSRIGGDVWGLVLRNPRISGGETAIAAPAS
jgi:hypothetical protein